jgi:hypothetical protein
MYCMFLIQEIKLGLSEFPVRPYLRLLNIFAFLQNCSFGPGTVILSKFVRHSLNTTGSPT